MTKRRGHWSFDIRASLVIRHWWGIRHCLHSRTMRQIGSISSDHDAERFSDYLLTQGIGNMVEEGAGGGAWAVWVENDDHLDRGRSELEQFRANPADPRYEAAG